ncbi:MAG: rRNA methyltransferase [Candidatus Marinimicrobia bacterium]|jgi:16S rRNA C967 or C1407 C5-methylase (RsmB/RsmF family)/NOL1/NOP2/fmu family ribosome biogenesis protein|nr:rRNA methyltransferase [Candidatus Neomarinimicrobiota bacterium]MBT4945398.1 rRNA methyltransferase [Candidatus Neomarinimicrobiota bacterium]MBT5270003.1 rRNA methyltransferase [Candidatus Neomarinimicrobiota bacterium]MBT6012744.1 rRNA methyltransferase [Candidatus Neomarinimicrobiota bacterium]
MTDPSIKLPSHLENRLRRQLGEEYEQFYAALREPPPISIRMNPGKPTNQYPNTAPIAWSEQGKYLESRPRFTNDPLFHAGTYYVQEASSMFLEHALKGVIDLEQNHRVLDLSAAPGGKTTHLQSLLSKDSLLIANEIIASRNKILRQNLARWGGDNHIVTQSDPKYFKKLPNFFDLILVDAPCSGEGLMRKDPGAIKEWSEDNVLLCSRRQKRILADILPSLAKGGILIYSTCTFSEAENEANMEWLEQESGLTPLPLDIPESWGIVKSGPDQTSYRFYPHHTSGEGFFIAAFRMASSPSVPGKSRRKPIRYPELATPEDQKWLQSPDRYTFLTREEHRHAIPKSIYEDYLTISRSLRITSSGLYMGKVYHGELKPSPELALNQALSRDIQCIELSSDEALDYLAHINKSHGEDYQPGYNLVVHQGYGLGWLHVLKTGQIRNKYPAAWRILQRHPKY